MTPRNVPQESAALPPRDESLLVGEGEHAGGNALPPRDVTVCGGQPHGLRAEPSPPLQASPWSGAVLEARRLFPRGLVQPEGAYRFSADALVLARFALDCLAGVPGEAPLVADLGTGCGVVGLAMLLAGPEALAIVGVEREPALAAAARENAIRLGLEGHFSVIEGDVAELAATEPVAVESLSAPQNEGVKSLWKGGGLGEGEPCFSKVSIPQLQPQNALGRCSLVAANPPWRLLGTCRVSPSPLRRAALVGDEATFPAFAGAAKALLRRGGIFAVSVGTVRLGALENAVRGTGMAVERVCRAHEKFALVACRRL